MLDFYRSLRVVLMVSCAPLAGCADEESSIAGTTEKRRELGSWSEPSPLLGFSLADVLPDELYTSELVWNEPTADVKFSPASSRTVLRWCLAVPDPQTELGSIQEVDVRCPSGRAGASQCEDRLEATLLLRLKSEDGALDDDLPVTFAARSTREASFSAPDLTFRDFAGSFVISNTGRPDETLRFGLFGSLDAQSASGSLLADWTSVDGEASEVVYPIANWSAQRADDAPPCAAF